MATASCPDHHNRARLGASRSAVRFALPLLVAMQLTAACKGSRSSESESGQRSAKDSTGAGAAEKFFASHGDEPKRPPPAHADFVIVAADQLAAAAKRYQEYRQGTGHKVELALVGELASSPAQADEVPERIKAFVAKHYAARDPDRPFYALLLGDAPQPLPAAVYHEPFNGSMVTSDNFYADMNGDHVPDLAIGRISARSDDELDRIREKIARYESSYRVGEFNRRIHIIAVPGGFGAFIDSMIEALAYQLLDNWSYKYDITFTYASSKSPVFFSPESFSDKVYSLLNEGSLFSVYVGHGTETGLDDVMWEGQSYRVLDEYRLADKLHMQNKPGVMLLFTCLTGSFDVGDSLAEQLLRLDGGPPAVVASSEISHPYPNAVLLKEFGWLAAKHRERTVGRLFQQAKVRLIEHKGYCRELIDKYGSLVIADDEVEAQKRTHLHMYTLLGDPATRMAYVAGRAWINLPSKEVKRGTELSVSANFKNLQAGDARFTLQTRREVIRGAIEPVPRGGDRAARDAVIEANYARANDKVVAAADVRIEAGSARATLKVPKSVPAGIYFVKVYGHDGKTDAFGHVSFSVAE